MDHEKGEKTRPLSAGPESPILLDMVELEDTGGSISPGKALFFLVLFALGTWGVVKDLRAGKEGWTPPSPFHLSRWKPLHVRPGEPRLLPWVHRDFELSGRVVVPRDRHMDLVFHLERGPYQVSPRDDRTLPQGPLDWSVLRLSAGDMGPPFFSSRDLPEKDGGWRVPPGEPVDVRLVLRDGTARAWVGHRALPSTWKVHVREGLLAFVGEGTWEALALKSLDRKASFWDWPAGALLWLLGALVLAWGWKRVRFRGSPWLLGGAGAALAGWLVLLFPAPASKDPWDPKTAPSFQEAQALYGRAEGFRNWGAWAGSLFWRGRRSMRVSRTGGKRVLFLGGAQVWGRGVARKDSTFPMQVEGILDGARKPGTPSVEVLVGACRETDLGRQWEILRDDLLSFRPDLVVLVLPRGTPGPGPSWKKEEKTLEAFFAWAKKKNLPFLLVPPLVPGGSWEGSLDSLRPAARAAGGQVWDPGPWLKGKGLFLSGSSGLGRKGDLSPRAHLLLASPLAGELQKLVRF